MIILATIFSGLSLLMSILFPIRPKAFIIKGMVWVPILTAGSLSPYWAIMGAIGAIFGGISGAYWAIPMGIIGAGVMIWYVWRCTRDHKGFEDAFGVDWSDKISPEQANHIDRKSVV